jgi:hypothetical protein
MKRLVVMTTGVLAGVVTGAVLMLVAQGISGTGTTTSVVVPAFSAPTDPVPSILDPNMSEDSTTTTVESAPDSDQILLVWTPGGLPEGLAEWVSAIADVNTVTVVHSDLAHVSATESATGSAVDRPADGYVIPVEVMGFDPVSYPAFLPQAEAIDFTTVNPDQVILGATSAQIRRLDPGGVITFDDGSRFTVAAVVDDVLVGGAEAALPVVAAGPVGVETERYLLIRYSGRREDVESLIRGGLPDGLAVRIRAPGETPVLRHGDAVLPQVLIKEQFGEFAYRRGSGLTLEIPPDWIEDNIDSAEVPVLGLVTCHRNLLPALAGAMADLVERNLEFLVDPDGFRGCFNPRYIANGKGISRHSWGAAVDINIASNPEGLESAQDPRLVATMERWGFTSGHDWLVPDPGHFEYLRPAQGE